MKKVVSQKITSNLLYNDKLIIVSINEQLFEKKYNAYQRAFVLKIIIKGGTYSPKCNSKKLIWKTYNVASKTTIYVPYVDDIQELVDDGFIEIVSENPFGLKTYKVLDSAYGISINPFSKTEYTILQRGLN